MPVANVFLPGDVRAHELLVGQPCTGRLDTGCATRMPAGEQATLRTPRHVLQVMNFGERGSRRLLQKHMAAGHQRGLRQCVPSDRWRAQGHRFDLRLGGKCVFQGVIGGHTVDRAMPAHGGHQLHIVARGDGRHVLVAGDLADPDKGDTQCVWMLHRNLRAGRGGPMRTPARTLPGQCCSGAMRRAHATAQCTVSVQPTARHRSCLFCYTCMPAAAYRACSVAPRRQCATAADGVGAAVGIGGARPHATSLFCSMRLTPARVQTSIAVGTPMCRRHRRLHRCCITFRWAFVRSRYPPNFSTQRWVRLAMCGCGPIWSQARSTRRSAMAGPVATIAWR